MAKHWIRILVGGVGAELLYAIYIYFIAPSTQVAYQPIGFAMVFILFALGGWWVGRGMEQSRVLGGVLAGVAGTIFYYILQIPDIMAGEQSFPVIAFLNHGLKLAGGAIGAFVAGVVGRRRP
jgi:hypothetical protein